MRAGAPISGSKTTFFGLTVIKYFALIMFRTSTNTIYITGMCLAIGKLVRPIIQRKVLQEVIHMQVHFNGSFLKR